MSKYKTILIILIIIATISGCYYDKADVLYPPKQVCDTTTVKFSTDIFPTLNSNCKNCHSGTAASGGWNLETFSTIQNKALTGRLVFRITLPENHPQKMPRGRPKLDTCTILKIKAWANKGAPNN